MTPTVTSRSLANYVHPKCAYTTAQALPKNCDCVYEL